MEKYKSFTKLSQDVELKAQTVPTEVVQNIDVDKLAVAMFETLISIKETKDEVGLLYLKNNLLHLYKEHVKNQDHNTPKIVSMCKVGIRAIKKIEQDGFNF